MNEPLSIGGSVAELGLSIFRVQLLDRLSAFLVRRVRGSVKLAGWGVLSGYQSLIGDYPVLIRGSERSWWHICKECARVFVSNPFSPLYVLERELRDGSGAYQTARGELLLDQHLVDAVDWKQFPDAKLVKIKVLESPPKDNWLPCDPEWTGLKTPGLSHRPPVH